MIKVNLNKVLNLEIVDITGPADDIQFTLICSDSGEVIEDEEVYQYVNDNYSDLIYEEYIDYQIMRADDLLDMIKGH